MGVCCEAYKVEEDKRLLIAAEVQVVGEEEGQNFDVRETSQLK